MLKMCIRLNNLVQLKQLRKHLFENYNNVMQKLNNHLIKIKSRPKQTLFQQFKIELYKIKLYNRTIEIKLDKLTNGLIDLLVYRVTFFCFIVFLFYFIYFIVFLSSTCFVKKRYFFYCLMS